MKTLNQIIMFTLLMGGLSLSAMDNDDAMQLETLKTELQALSNQHDALDKEHREWIASMPTDEYELEPRYQCLRQEMTKLNGQREELKAQMETIGLKYHNPRRHYRESGIWFRCGLSYESEKK